MGNAVDDVLEVFEKAIGGIKLKAAGYTGAPDRDQMLFWSYFYFDFKGDLAELEKKFIDDQAKLLKFKETKDKKIAKQLLDNMSEFRKFIDVVYQFDERKQLERANRG